MKILIAEDDMTSRTMLQSVLGKWGYEVMATDNGWAALTAMQAADAPQLVLLDWMMPEVDGPSVCRELRQLDRQDFLYLILLTARGESDDIVQGLEAGADDYIAKPYNNAELRARVDVGRRMIDLQNAMREREKLQGVLEMAGAVCHELNQPLQSVSSFSELLLLGLTPSDPKYEMLQNIKSGIERIGELTRKIMRITQYEAKPYLQGSIVDIHRASE